MTETADRIVISEDDLIEFVEKPASGADGPLVMRVTYRSRSSRPDPHYHPHQDEHFRIESGSFRVWIDGREETYGPGDEFDVPRGASHWMFNAADEPGRLEWRVNPAARREEFFRILWDLRKSGLLNGFAGLIRGATILHRFRDEMRDSGRPVVLRRAILATLAFLGRMFGYDGVAPGP